MRFVVWIGLVIAGIVCLGGSSSAQGRGRLLFPVDNRVTAEIDRSLLQAIDEAQVFIEQKQYAPAVMRLQTILDHPEDYFLEKDFRFKKPVGVRAQALQMLADLPAQGQAAYELQVGSIARDLLKVAQLTNDVEKLYDVASSYQMTSAGFEALQLLTGMAFDHDRLIEAGLLCETMLRHPKSTGPLKTSLLLRSAFAWYLAGETDRSLSALTALNEVKGDAAWQIGGRAITPFKNLEEAPEWLATHFGPVLRSNPQTVDDWEMPRGGLTGNESASPTCPVGGGLWAISARQYLRFVSDDVVNQQRIEGFDQLTNQLEKMMRDNNRLTQPAAIPVIVGDVVVYRTLNDVTAVSLKTGRLLWRSATTDGMLGWIFQSPLASSDMINAASPVTFRGYLRRKLFRDQLSGSLTSDGENLYAIEESESQFSMYLPRSRQLFGAQTVSDPVNKLVAYDLKGGRLVWEIGGQNGTPPIEFSGFFFVGPPLPFGGRLYCLAESKNEMRLVCLTSEEKTAKLEWSQALITTDRVVFEPPFREAGLVPAISDGLMICPTAYGSVVAFDIVQRQLKWGYSYDSPSRKSSQGSGEIIGDVETGRWLDSGPVLAGGCVVLTPRDSNEIHCLNLVDGTKVWKRQRQQGLYVACVNGEQVIVVGRSQVMAYSLADGSEVWNQPMEIPEPSGRGVRIGSQYLIPLSTGHIATFDLTAGQILGRSRLPGNRIPGNLAAGEGALVSCGINDVVGFRPLGEVEQQIDRQLAADPANAEALALRGELRLHRGKDVDAIDDLRRSLKQQPQLRVKRILVEAMLDRSRNDPRQLLQSSVELQSLSEDPRQKIEVTQLLASALNETGDRPGAVAQLFRLALATQIPEEMVASGPDHFVSLEQSLRSQLFGIYDAASSSERAEIVKVFGKELDAILATADRNHRLLKFVKFTIGHPAANRLLLRLADTNDVLPGELSRTKLLERIAGSEDKQVAAAAVAALASRFLASNAPREARLWIEELGQRFPSELLRDGKTTGRQLSDEWMARNDIRQLNIARLNWPQGEVEVNRTENHLTQATWPVDVVTHVGNYFKGWTFETDALVTMLTARDPNFKVVWRFPLLNPANELRIHPSQLHIRGRRLAFSSGMWLAVMEVADSQSEPHLLFEKSLRPGAFVSTRANNTPVERRLLPNGRRFQLMYDNRGSAGFLIGLADDAVFYQLDNRLFAADPETGQTLWSRSGLQFAKADATADTSLVVNAPDNGAYLLRTIDGTIQQEHRGNANETPIWFRGTRRLSLRNQGLDQRVFELRDFDGDRVIWQSQHQATSMPSVIDDEDLAVLEPSGKLTVLKLATGEVRLTTDLPVKRPLRGVVVMAAQRWEDRYIIVAGVQSKTSGERRVIPLNFGSPKDFQSPRELGAPSNVAFTIDGTVCSIDRNDGKVLWSVPVAELAFDTAQPVSVPVLVLASWYVDIDARNGFPLAPKLSSLILDKRTGAKIYEKQEALDPGGRGVQFVPSIDNRKLVVDFYHFQLELTFPQSK